MGLWAVYDDKGHKYESYATQEEARKVVFELNGWENYKPRY